jgi:acyl-CoA thioester hydrolase
MGHMNVMWYAGKFDEATWHLLASAGLTAKRMREEGIGMAAVDQRIEYKRELLAGDLITIHSWFQEVREKALLLVHKIANEETQEVAARTFLAGVCLDTNTARCLRMFASALWHCSTKRQLNELGLIPNIYLPRPQGDTISPQNRPSRHALVPIQLRAIRQNEDERKDAL